MKASTLLLLLLLSLNTNLVFCDCIDSFVVICDSLRDINSISRSVRFLHIQGDQPQDILRRETVDFFHRMPQLNLLIVSGILKEVESGAFDQPFAKFIKEIILYGNKLRRIEGYTFANYTHDGLVHLKILELKNNEIENLDPYAFYLLNFDVLDLSHNKLTTLRGSVFHTCNIKNLYIKHNRLSKIQPDTLPSNIKSLFLDFNNFEYLVGRDINSATKLELLSVSHNKVSHVEGLNFVNLWAIDLSFNDIYSFQQREVGNFFKLRYLDLSHNNLEKFSLSIDFVQEAYFLLALAYNNLRNIDLTQFIEKDTIVTLVGNPWNCQCLDEMNKILQNSTNRVHRTLCDSEIFKMENMPRCVINYVYNEPCTDNVIYDEDSVQFSTTL